MSNLFSTVQNYSGRQPDNVQNIKQFVTTAPLQITWIYSNITPGGTVITPSDQTKNILVPLNLYVNGSIFNPSDLNLKKKIYGLSKEKTEQLLDLNPVEFQYKSDITEKRHFGLIAQQMEGIFPELVSNDMKGYKTVNYIELLPIMLSKMKSMQEEINELKNLCKTK
jgi:hypothetical protein